MAEAGSQWWHTGHKERQSKRKKERKSNRQKEPSRWEYRGIIMQMWGGGGAELMSYLSGSIVLIVWVYAI